MGHEILPGGDAPEIATLGLTRIRFEQFTAFESLNLELSPGVNVFIGANGTGKTHLLKAAYAACDVTRTGFSFAEKLTNVFLPTGRAIGRLVRRKEGGARGSIEVWRGDRKLRISFSNRSAKPSGARVTGRLGWSEEPMESVFIPVKEMLSNGPGFLSLYRQREIHFEEVYADVLIRAHRPPLREPVDKERKQVLRKLQEAAGGKIAVRNEEFFLASRRGNLEFTLLAEGLRKLGLLWLLVQNGTLRRGSVLFWDEPETNLSPQLRHVLVGALLELQRLGVQVLLATHDYSVLKELDLLTTAADHVLFHAFHYEGPDDRFVCETARSPFVLRHSPIDEAFSSLYDREIERSLRGAR